MAIQSKLAYYSRGGMLLVFASLFLASAMAANITYDGITPTPQTAPDPTSTGNSLFPGTTASPIASGNTITINYNPVGGLNDPVRVFGGINGSQALSVTGNHVNMINGTVNERIYGGYDLDNYGASGNTVFMFDGTVAGRVVGGHSVSGDAVSNSVTMSNGTAGSLFGGTAGSTGTVANNQVFMSGGTVLQVWGGSGGVTSGTVGLVTANRVHISGGSVTDSVYGGGNSGGSVTDNWVTLSGGVTVGGQVTGGSQTDTAGGGLASGNHVYVTDATIAKGIIGGYCSGLLNSHGNASDNHVVIAGGSIAGFQMIDTLSASVFGGATMAGNADGNSVTILGGVVSGDVYGGVVHSGSGSSMTATNNSVTISGTPDISNANLYGGRIYTGNGDSFTGNTLNVNAFSGSVQGTYNFENYNFFLLPASVANGDTVLVIAGGTPTDLAGANVAITGVQGGVALQPGAAVILIGSTTNWFASGTATDVRQGVAMLYDFDLDATSGQLTAAVTAARMNTSGMKPLAEGWLAGLAFLREGADLVAAQGMVHARLAVANNRSGPAAFAVAAGGSIRNKSGSHVDVDSFSMLAGLAWNACPTPGYLTLGAFFEGGWGNYDSYNDFAGFASVRGDGNTRYFGGGLLGRLDLPGGFYAEASARAGRVDTDFASGDIPGPPGRVGYDSGSAYYGAHAGVGYNWNFTEKANLDLFTKYLWTHQNSADVNVLGDPIHFAAADSRRWRAGARLSFAATPRFSPYVGAAYEYEFDGEARASAYGYSIDAPGLKGSTGIGELGVTYKAAADCGFYADLGVQGYVGKREGVTGSLRLGWKF